MDSSFYGTVFDRYTDTKTCAFLFKVIKNTGFLKGLYTTEEMNSANVKV